MEITGADEFLDDPGRAITDDLVTLLFGLMHRSNAHHAACLFELGLSRSQSHALRRLSPGRAVPQGQLAEALVKDPSNLTTVLHQLEERGLIARWLSEYDRRVRVVQLTEAGQAVREQLLNCVLDKNPVAEGLSTPDRRKLRDLLRQLEIHAPAYNRQPKRPTAVPPPG